MKKISRKINFDICTYCNHACNFCSNPDSRTIKSMTSLEEFEKVMDNVMRYVETKELGLSAKGEPLLNKNLPTMIKLAKKKYKIPYIYISSNGALCTKEKAFELFEAGLDSIKFSINSIDKASYAKIHGKDEFDKVIENFKHVLKLKKEDFLHVKILISSVLQNVSKKELEERFEEIFQDDFELIDKILYYPVTFTAKDIVEKKDVLKLPKCTVPFNELWINSDGTLGLCCKDYFDEINFGSLIHNDFLDIYDSCKFADIKRMHKESIFQNEGKLCEKCLLFGL